MTISNDNPVEHVKRSVEMSLQAKQEFWQTHAEQVCKAARIMAEAAKNGGKVLIFGNGGSAADAQHMAAEMVGRMLVERKRPLAALALTTDTSNITAIGNDYSFDDIFRLQVEGLGQKGDVAVAISTSGNSKNVMLAVEAARKAGMSVVSLTGGSGGKLREMSDVNLNVALGKHSSMIQETHITIVHLLVDLMDRFYLPKEWMGAAKQF